jgi:hypothetical protein
LLCKPDVEVGLSAVVQEVLRGQIRHAGHGGALVCAVRLALARTEAGGVGELVALKLEQHRVLDAGGGGGLGGLLAGAVEGAVACDIEPLPPQLIVHYGVGLT